MALHLQTLKTRALTAVVFVMVMLLGLLWSKWSFFMLFTVIHFGCWVEYQKLAALADPGYTRITPFHKYGVMIAGYALMLYFTSDQFHIGSLSLHALGWWLALIMVFVLPVSGLLFAGEVNLKHTAYSIIGLLYISLSWGLMMDLENPGVVVNPGGSRMHNWHIPALIIACMWINDTMAYLVGSLIGKTPFSSISPKKTWEGTLGGAFLCVAIITYFFQPLLHWKHLLLISLICAVTGTMGDLLESWLKRKANVKDSGTIMPGHGGFLDRFDSLILATPFVWAYVHFFM